MELFKRICKNASLFVIVTFSGLGLSLVIAKSTEHLSQYYLCLLIILRVCIAATMIYIIEYRIALNIFYKLLPLILLWGMIPVHLIGHSHFSIMLSVIYFFLGAFTQHTIYTWSVRISRIAIANLLNTGRSLLTNPTGFNSDDLILFDRAVEDIKNNDNSSLVHSDIFNQVYKKIWTTENTDPKSSLWSATRLSMCLFNDSFSSETHKSILYDIVEYMKDVKNN